MEPKTIKTEVLLPPVEIHAIEPEEQIVSNLEATLATLQPEGGISEHKNRYGDNPQDCPFLASLGEAGIRLAEQLQAAQTNPNRGKTIGEILAEKQQQKAAQEKPSPFSRPPEILVSTPPTLAAREIATRLEEVYLHEKQKQTLLTEKIEEVMVKPVALSTEASIAVEPLPALTQIELPKESVPTLKRVVRDVQPQTNQEVSLTLTPKQNQTVVTRPRLVTHQNIVVATPALKVQEAPITSGEEAVEAMLNEPTPEASPDITPTVLEKTIKEAPIAVEPRAILTPEITEAVETITLEMPTIEAILEEWLSAESPVQETIGSDLQPEPGITLSQDTETKIQVVEVLEVMVQVLHEVQTGERTIEAATEQLQEITIELFELLGFKPSKDTIKTIVQDILLTWQEKPFDPITSSIDKLNNTGTHEYKLSLAKTVQTHVSHAIQERLKRITEISRYILTKLTRPIATASLAVVPA